MWTTRIGLLGLAALAAACSTARKPEVGAAPIEADSTSGSVKVRIDNQNYADMNIYLLNNGVRMLVGTAQGLSNTTLTLPSGAAGGNGWKVRLLADPVGGADIITTGSLLVAPGESVYWTIGSDPSTSHATTG